MLGVTPSEMLWKCLNASDYQAALNVVNSLSREDGSIKFTSAALDHVVTMFDAGKVPTPLIDTIFELIDELSRFREPIASDLSLVTLVGYLSRISHPEYKKDTALNDALSRIADRTEKFIFLRGGYQNVAESFETDMRNLIRCGYSAPAAIISRSQKEAAKDGIVGTASPITREMEWGFWKDAIEHDNMDVFKTLLAGMGHGGYGSADRVAGRILQPSYFVRGVDGKDATLNPQKFEMLLLLLGGINVSEELDLPNIARAWAAVKANQGEGGLKDFPELDLTAGEQRRVDMHDPHLSLLTRAPRRPDSIVRQAAEIVVFSKKGIWNVG